MVTAVNRAKAEVRVMSGTAMNIVSWCTGISGKYSASAGSMRAPVGVRGELLDGDTHLLGHDLEARLPVGQDLARLGRGQG